MQVFISKAKLLNFWHLKGSGQALKNYLKVKIPTCNLPLFLTFANLHVLSLSQKHGDDQFSMILQQPTSYVLVCQLNNFIIYNTHLNTLYIYAFGPERQEWLKHIPPPSPRSEQTTPKDHYLPTRYPPAPP